MKEKKYKKKVYDNGTEAFTVEGGIGFYTPFCLLKKDFKFKKENLSVGIRPVLFAIEMLKSIAQDNRVTTSNMRFIGNSLGMKPTAITNLISELVKAEVLIKVSQGIYKVNEMIVIYKLDQSAFLALKEETKALTQNNTTNNINITLNPESSERLVDRLLAEKHAKDKLDIGKL